MKPVITSAVIAAAAAVMAAPAFAKDGPEVEIRHAVARVAVIVEDRTDVVVEVEQGASGLPAIQVTRVGNEVRIDGGLRRRGFLNRRSSIRECRSGPDNAARPGEGASVEVRDHGRINISDAPLIVIRTPRHVDVSASGAVFGSVGRGASSVELGNAGCGYWNVANTEGPVSLSIAGSGDLRAGTSTSLDVSIAGSGSAMAGATRELDVSIAGSGDVTVARIDGPMDVSIAGSGDVVVRDGTSPDVDISILGSGDVNFGGVAVDVDISIAGGGDVAIARATGSVSRSIAGSGDIRIGN
ncbi:GIN domain-containing protein [Brevundimonas sp.]|uniref:GIN domain-containing protein n=1 Tax=Brevundimonas sp. TaxID=1871086 RepID=UPI003F71671D